MRGEERLAMGDCAINIDPSEDEIVEITVPVSYTHLIRIMLPMRIVLNNPEFANL